MAEWAWDSFGEAARLAISNSAWVNKQSRSPLIIRETERERWPSGRDLAAIPQGLIGVETRFPAAGCRIEDMIDPLRRDQQNHGKVWIELGGLLFETVRSASADIAGVSILLA